jgi:hypothetical protein
MDGTPDPYAVVEDSSVEPLGVIYGNVGSVDFNFAVTGAAHKLDYIQCLHGEHGLLLGQIVDLFRETRLSYDGASLISAEGDDKEVKGRLSARVHLFGYTDGQGHLEAPLTPLNAGQHVCRAEDAFVEGVLGLRGRTSNGGIRIGRLKGHDIPVALDANTLIQRHVSVIAKTGGGKSYMAGLLVEGLMEVGVPVVIVDPHGEYGSLMYPNTDAGDLARMHEFGVRPEGFTGSVVEYAVDQELNIGALPIRFSERGMDPATLLEMAGMRSSGPQLALLASAVEMLRAQGVRYGFDDIIEVLHGDRAGSRWNVINALVGLQGSGIFSDHPTDPGNLVKPGQCTVVNLRGLGPDIANIAVAMLMKLLFEGRKKGTVRPHMLVLEEAHTFCPQGGHTQARDLVRTVAAEGRKFGMGMAVITQRPAKVDKNVLSQCHTQIILKVTNPNDLRSVTAAAEGLTTRMGDEIQRLPVGVALVVGGSLAAPVLVEARPRRTKHGGRDIDVVGDALNGGPHGAPATFPTPTYEAVSEPEALPLDDGGVGAGAPADTPVAVSDEHGAAHTDDASTPSLPSDAPAPSPTSDVPVSPPSTDTAVSSPPSDIGIPPRDLGSTGVSPGDRTPGTPPPVGPATPVGAAVRSVPRRRLATAGPVVGGRRARRRGPRESRHSDRHRPRVPPPQGAREGRDGPAHRRGAVGRHQGGAVGEAQRGGGDHWEHGP